MPPAEGRQLPFAPRSFRDCMLFRQHWIDSSRGFTKRFLPRLFPLTQIYEAITRHPFPAFTPSPLFERQPLFYFGNHSTIIASGTPIPWPRYASVLDYELELGVVLSAPLLNASVEDARAAIGGFVLVNDLTCRNVQRAEMQTGLGPQKAKSFGSSMSDSLVTSEAIWPQIDRLTGRVEINGDIVAEVSSVGMEHKIDEVLAYLSVDEPLYPGELIATGTLPGGSGMENGRTLRVGDRLRLVLDGVGEVEHDIGPMRDDALTA